jgi:hypothetical protein
VFPQLLAAEEIGHAVRDQSWSGSALAGLSNPNPSWQPGQLHPNLSWTHYRTLIVFYHVILKCYILINLKVGKLTHGDLGQLQLYVNYYDQERCAVDDNPTLGLILYSDKNDAVVKYTLGPEQHHKIFASRYKLHLPTEAELKAELRREVSQLQTDRSPQKTSQTRSPFTPKR